ncbi:MAG: acetyl-CoA carboxylase, carboxyltransferase subunit beta [Sulfurimonas sp.]|uniref:acetyl-CoA carboxylase, carboxyltransferase subunit beta n=1 Tax=Sulfurimonas sp. TaxID=2022749 RepID=UPI002604763E|nr:acetyl-CoA carboxylase, carboxyltransferase subunit beta [Sulfurimonas sp.]MCW8894483.1 acetyl-CoA carboxylase, carboxyltransferase subunit beta [Sulfurimonas sp.]MCW8954100.1 acetyl-CoA carboxylase, carboxyltransferase subunit beta [Sulfurimonas sp.]MCW9067836.1 acetyl-CoA carboxylase, carboxyltransferase subunit beta [Sulfurimonas sp.]
MNLLSIFSRNITKKQPAVNEASSHWVKCKSCQSLMYYKEVENQKHVCPKCGYHIRIGVKERIELLADEGTFVEYDASMKPVDPLNFFDSKSYKQRIEDATAKTGKTSSVVSGEMQMNGVSAQVVIFDFAFMGGSLGSVEGEKIVRAVERAIEKKLGVVILSASGGARMQESTFSLLQMSKTSAALAKLAKANLPYISVLTDPTMGGVSASFATLGDIIIAEPGALVGFAGARVIEQTIGSALPDGFQRAEFLLEKGSIDMIVNRSDLKNTLSDLLTLLKVA